MLCPECKNKGFRASEEIRRPLFNMGNKQYFPTFIIRRYVCLQCAYKFKTKEVFFEEVQGGQQLTIFDTLGINGGGNGSK